MKTIYAVDEKRKVHKFDTVSAASTYTHCSYNGITNKIDTGETVNGSKWRFFSKRPHVVSGPNSGGSLSDYECEQKYAVWYPDQERIEQCEILMQLFGYSDRATDLVFRIAELPMSKLERIKKYWLWNMEDPEVLDKVELKILDCEEIKNSSNISLKRKKVKNSSGCMFTEDTDTESIWRKDGSVYGG